MARAWVMAVGLGMAAPLYAASIARAQAGEVGFSVREAPAVTTVQQPAAASAESFASSPHELPPDEPRDEPPKKGRPRSRWYGWQTLAADAGGVALIALGAQGDSAAAILAGGYFLGAPIVHLAHDRPGAALGSLALRIGLPATGMLVNDALAECREGSDDDNGFGSDRCAGETAPGILIGVGAAIILDATVLARKPPNRERAHSARAPALVPGVAITAGRRALVLTGRF